MTRDEVLCKYLELISDKGSVCNSKLHRKVYKFGVFSIIFYYVANFGIDTISFVGMTLNIPNHFLIAVAPLVLTYLYYSIVCFIKLESTYYREQRWILAELNKTAQIPFERWQGVLLETPSYYTWMEVCGPANEVFQRRGNGVVARLIHMAYVLAPLFIVGYFTYKSVDAFKPITLEDGCLIALYLFNVYLCLHSYSQWSIRHVRQPEAAPWAT